MISSPRVLVVDDEPEILELIQETLEIQGIACITAMDGEVALKLLELNPSIQLVVSDINMPVMGGVALRENAGKCFGERSLTWVALTTPGLQDYDGSGIPGFDATFYKPYSFSELARLIRIQVVD
jgi:two-component system CheB/CheR fusion protein